MKRFLACLLALTCLLSCAHAQMKLPAGLLAVEEEAFLNTAALKRVVVPEGTLQIGPRAFKGSSLREIVLPASVVSIAEDAFDGCDDLTLQVPRDSYAHQWCALRDLNYEIIDGGAVQAVQYGVHALEWTGSAIRAVVTAGGACTLHTQVQQEDGSVLFSMNTPLKAGLENAEIEVVPAEAMPESFVLYAVLVDAAGAQLCDGRTDHRHTAAHAEFESRTPEDYAAARVLDFGDSGFAVLNEDVLQLDVQATVSGETYTFSDAGFALQRGNVLCLQVDGEDKLIKVAAAACADGQWTVQADPDIYLAECFDVLKIDAYMTGQTLTRGVDESVNVFDVAPSLDLGVGEAGVHAWANVRLKAAYDVNLLGADYFETELSIEVNGDVSISLQKEIDTFKNDSAPAIQLYNSVVIIPYVPAPAFLNVSLPLNIYAKAGGVITAGFSNVYGFSFSTRDGFSQIETENSHAEAQIEGEISAELGPEVSLTVALFEFFNARLGGGFGLGAEGELQTPAYGGSTITQDSVHACLACVDMDTYAYARMRGTVVYKINEHISGALLDKTIAEGKEELSPAYYSFENEANSVFGGAATFDWGACPNYKHRVEVSTLDAAGAAVSGIPLTISGAKTEALAASSPAAAYLYDGDYTAAADFASAAVQKSFSVQGAKQSITLQEKLAAVSGVVSDKATGKALSGAAVTLTLPDGSTRSAVTDASGAYRFENLPGGTCSLAFAKKDYKDQILSDVSCPAGEDAVVNVSLVSSLMPDEAVMRYLVDCFGEDLIQRMKDAQITLGGSFEYYVPAGMPAETEEGTFMKMELRLTTPLNFTYPVDQVDYEVMRDAQCALLDANVFSLTAEEIAACKELIFNPYSQGENVFVQNETVEHYMIESPNYQGVVLLRHNYSTWDETNVLNQLLKTKTKAWNSYIVWDELQRRTYTE